MQFLRADDGGYWTGANFESEAFHLDGELFPVEQPTWNSAAVVLAAERAGRRRARPRACSAASASPTGLYADELLAAGVEIADERDAAHEPASIRAAHRAGD